MNNFPSDSATLLAIDTATEACSAALLQGEKIISRFKIAPREHTKLILPMMDEVLEEANVKLSDIDAVAFGRGPGAFTGVRIATGVAHGLSLAIDKQLLPISTLAAIAQQVFEEQGADRCIAAIDARMGEVYWGKYIVKNSVMILQGEEVVSKPEALLNALDNKSWTVAGSGWDEYADQLSLSNQENIIKIEGVLPSAKYLVRLAMEDWRQGKSVSAEQAQPIYLRDKVADTIAERAVIK